jgi:hypothetical protein
MNHSNMYAVGLALCTFANIASEEMSRDLANEIEKLLGSSNTYIRKKVANPCSAYVYLCSYIYIFRPLCVHCESSRKSPTSPITSLARPRISSRIATTVFFYHR